MLIYDFFALKFPLFIAPLLLTYFLYQERNIWFVLKSFSIQLQNIFLKYVRYNSKQKCLAQITGIACERLKKISRKVYEIENPKLLSFLCCLSNTARRDTFRDCTIYILFLKSIEFSSSHILQQMEENKCSSTDWMCYVLTEN